MRRNHAWRILFLVLLIFMLLACESETAVEEEEVSSSYQVVIKSASYSLSPDLSTLTADEGTSYEVTGLEVTINGVSYVLTPVYSEDGSVSGYTASEKEEEEDETEEEEVVLLSLSEDAVYTGPLGDLVVSDSECSLSGYTLTVSGSSVVAEADGISWTLILDSADSTYISVSAYEGVLGDIILTESIDGKGNLSSIYSLEGYELSVTDSSFTAVKDGVTYTVTVSGSSYSSSVSYKASSSAYKLGTIVVTDFTEALVKGESYEVEDGSFEYTLTSGTAVSTYVVTLDDSTATYSTEKATVTVYEGEFGSLTATEVSGTITAVLDGVEYEVEDGVFTLVVDEGSLITTYTIALGSDGTYTATAEEAIHVYTASSEDGDIGEVYVTETFGSTETSFGSESGYIITASSDGVLTVTTKSGSVTYTLTLDGDESTYTLETEEEVETLSDSGLGAITLVTASDGTVTAVLDGEEYEVEDGSFSYTESEDNKTVTYTVVISDDGYEYTNVTVETYYGSLGVITVTDGESAEIPGESGEYEIEDGEISYMVEGSGSVTYYTITLSSDYTYTLTETKSVVTYTASSSDYDFGTLTATTEDGVTTAVFEDDNKEYTVSSGSFSYESEDGSTTTKYTVTLKSGGTYNVVKTEEATVYETDFGDVTITKVFGITTAVVDTEVTIDSTVYTVSATEDSDGGFTLTVTSSDSSATYTLTLSDDGIYTSDASTVTYVAAEGSVDLGSIVVVGSTVTVGGSSETLSGSSLEYTTEEEEDNVSVTSDYTITLASSDSSNLKDDSDYVYTYSVHTDKTVTVTTDEFTGYELGTVERVTTVTDTYDESDNVTSVTGVIATVGSSEELDITESPSAFTYGIYAITLAESTYSYVYDADYSGALETLTETRTVQADGETAYSYAMTGYTLTDNTSSIAAVKDSVTFTLYKDDESLSYSYNVTYTVASGYVDLGGIEYSVDKDGNATCQTYEDITWIDKDPVVYSAALQSDYTYTTSVEQTTYTAASGAEDFGKVVVKGSTATIESSSETISDNSFYHTNGAVEYYLTLNTSAYTYSTAEYKITYTEQGSTIGLDIVVTVATSTATIGGSGSYTVTSSNTISEVYNVSPYNYNITLNYDDKVYTTSVYSTVYTYYSGVGTLGDITVVQSTKVATVSGTALSEYSESVYHYEATLSSGKGGISIYGITLSVVNSTPVYSTTAYETTYVESTSIGLGSITVVDTTATVGSSTVSLSSSTSTSFSYTLSKGSSYGSATYAISLSTSAYTYSATTSYITYVAYGSNQNIGSIKIASGTSITLADSTTMTKSSSATSFSCTYSGVSYYDVTLNSTYYTYTADKRIVVTYTDSKSYYGTITVTVTNGSVSSYSISSGSYGESLYSLSGTTVQIAVGYVRFSGSLSVSPTSISTSGSGGTYSATTLYYIDSGLLSGWGEYEIDVYFFYIHNSSYYHYYTDYKREIFFALKGDAGDAHVGVVSNCMSKLSTDHEDCGATMQPDGLTIVATEDHGEITVKFDASDSTIATVNLDGYVPSIVYSASKKSYVSSSSTAAKYALLGKATLSSKSHEMDDDVIYLSTKSKSGYTLTNSVGSKNVSNTTSTGDLYYKYSVGSDTSWSSYISAIVEFSSKSYSKCGKYSW